MFEETSRLTWAEGQEIAASFAPTVQQQWPAFYEEIKGVIEPPSVFGLQNR